MISNIASMPQVKDFLNKINFPVGKQSLIDQAKQHGMDDKITSMMQKLPDKQYSSASDVTNELGNIKQ
jgi:hypothetical protein